MSPTDSSIIRLMILQSLAAREAGLSAEFLRAMLDVHGVSMTLPGLNAELRYLGDKNFVGNVGSPLHPEIQTWIITERGKAVLTETQGRSVLA